MADRPSEMHLLRRTLVSNSAFSALTGGIMIAAAAPLSRIFGVPWTWVLAGLGVGLLGFAAEVYRHARAAYVGGAETRVIIALDVAWVAGSMVLLGAYPSVISVEGRWLMVAAALVVAGFATFQYLGLRRGRGT